MTPTWLRATVIECVPKFEASDAASMAHNISLELGLVHSASLIKSQPPPETCKVKAYIAYAAAQDGCLNCVQQLLLEAFQMSVAAYTFRLFSFALLKWAVHGCDQRPNQDQQLAQFLKLHLQSFAAYPDPAG